MTATEPLKNAAWFHTVAKAIEIASRHIWRPFPVDEGLKPIKASRHGWRYRGDNQTMFIEPVSPFKASTHFQAWMNLLDRAIEPNIFFDPAILVPAAQHLAIHERPEFVLVWDENETERGRLIGVFPIVFPKFLRLGFAQIWCHEHCELTTPLLDQKEAPRVLEVVVDWIGREYPNIEGIRFSKLRLDGGLIPTMIQNAIISGREIVSINQFQRAMLKGKQGQKDEFSAFIKKSKRLMRSFRRLQDKGTIAYERAQTIEQVQQAVEQFLVLEAKGWKGLNKTALFSDPGRRTFARVMMRLLGGIGRCRIDSLLLNGQPIAMIAVLCSHRHAYLWKIAYDENFARFSPGVQLLSAVSLHLRDDVTINVTDSCAIPDHPMVNQLWKDRLTIVDIALSVHSRPGISFYAQTYVTRAMLVLRAQAKRLLRRSQMRK